MRSSSQPIHSTATYSSYTHKQHKEMFEVIATGLAFGGALVASGMYSPYLIASQFTLQRWNMVQTFLTATGCSA